MEMVICKGRISRDYVEILNESVKHNFGYSISIGVSTAQKDATNLRNLARGDGCGCSPFMKRM